MGDRLNTRLGRDRVDLAHFMAVRDLISGDKLEHFHKKLSVVRARVDTGTLLWKEWSVHRRPDESPSEAPGSVSVSYIIPPDPWETSKNAMTWQKEAESYIRHPDTDKTAYHIDLSAYPPIAWDRWSKSEIMSSAHFRALSRPEEGAGA